MPDAIVVGAGPNGLAAAIALARAGRSVRVLEAAATVGGGTRTAELTLPGYRHDVCSAIHPLAAGSPFLRTLPLERYGLEWIHSEAPLAHPLDGGQAVMLQRSLDGTAAGLAGDGVSYRGLFGPLVGQVDDLLGDLLGPARVPRHPLLLARFGLSAVRSAHGLATAAFGGEKARALFAGLSAHSMLPLTRPPSAAFGLVLGLLAHRYGWPVARGGSQAIADAMVSYLRSLGGEIECGRPVESIAELTNARAVLLDLSPKGLLSLAGDRLPRRYARQLSGYRFGPGVFKLDLALDGPIPWAATECACAATVHVGGTLDEIVRSEAAVWRGERSARPYVLVAQQSLIDSTRAPHGKQTVWAYCHVPNGSSIDMTDAIESQIERFAPGFRDRILARHATGPPALEAYNPNYVGGDINAGVQDLRQLFTRPVARLVPYRTPLPGVYLCSASTPPGGGVHGMCGYWAARAALRGPLW